MPSTLVVLATIGVVYRAWSRNSLTPIGLAVATVTAVIHAVHPWSIFFWLLATFFLVGTYVTKVKHVQKSKYTTSSTGLSAGLVAPPRTATQVLCNSLPATVLITLHLYYLRNIASSSEVGCFSNPASPRSNSSLASSLFAVLPYGIIANYACAAADTFSSELGILSATPPFLITDVVGLLRFSPKRVPRGTNGGVTLYGLLSGFFGATIVAMVSLIVVPMCRLSHGLWHDRVGWNSSDKAAFGCAIAAWGALGSILDSVLGALLQASIVDARTGKVVEGDGGVKVLFNKATGSQSATSPSGRRLIAGKDILSNNGVNLLMLTIMSILAVLTASIFQAKP